MRNDCFFYKLIFLIPSCALVFFIIWLVFEKSSFISGTPIKADHTAEQKAERIRLPPKPIEKSEPNESTKQPSRIITRDDDSSKIYKWVDENGTIHFSDRPVHSNTKSVTFVPSKTDRSTESKEISHISRKALPQRTAQRDTRIPATQRGMIRARKLSRGQFVTSDGYRIIARAVHLGRELTFSGRVENGPSCSTLLLRGTLRNRDGGTRHLRARALDVGTLAKTYESKPTRVEWIKKAWDVDSLSVICEER